MKIRKALTILAILSSTATFTSCEFTGNTPLTGTISLWGDGWEASVDVIQITPGSSKNPIPSAK